MNGGAAKVGAVVLFDGRGQLGEVHLPIDPDLQVIGVNEVPQAGAGELEEGGVPAAPVQRFKHPDSYRMTACTHIAAQGWQRPSVELTFSTSRGVGSSLVSPGVLERLPGVFRAVK